MSSRLTVALLGAVLLLPATDAQAGLLRDDVDINDHNEKRQHVSAALAQARAAGGYDDPFTVLYNLFSGRDISDQIQPVINDPQTYEAEIRKNPAKK